MLKIKEAVIVEGKYDKIKLASLVDATIIATEGFGIFKDEEKSALIRHLAKTRGIVILTDSDSAGFIIRNHIKNLIGDSEGRVVNAYIPDVFGKEKRKIALSGEGKLGVEGVDSALILSALKSAGVLTEQTEAPKEKSTRQITRMDLYEDGIMGGEGSAAKRAALLNLLHLPEHMSVSALCEVINDFISYEQYSDIITRL